MGQDETPAVPPNLTQTASTFYTYYHTLRSVTAAVAVDSYWFSRSVALVRPFGIHTTTALSPSAARWELLCMRTLLTHRFASLFNC